jgi:hypothetical protein
MKSKLLELNKSSPVLEDFLPGILAMINSYYGHYCHANSFNLRKNVYEKKLDNLKEAFLPKPNYASLKLKDRHYLINN